LKVAVLFLEVGRDEPDACFLFHFRPHAVDHLRVLLRADGQDRAESRHAELGRLPRGFPQPEPDARLAAPAALGLPFESPDLLFPTGFAALPEDQPKGRLIAEIEGGLHPLPVLLRRLYVRVIEEAGDVEPFPQSPDAVGRIRGAADVEEHLFPAGDVGQKLHGPGT